MRLYHGTSSRHLDDILKNGLVPRGEKASIWEAASNEDAVYLTRTYALYFANAAADNSQDEMLIVEIDTNLLPNSDALCADEDAILFAWSHGAQIDVTDEDYMRGLDQHGQAAHLAGFLEDFATQGYDAEWSLKTIGNCTYHGTVPPEAITRILKYDRSQAWWYGFHDPLISPLNFRYCGSDYVASQLVVAGRLDEAVEYAKTDPMVMLPLDKLEELCARYRTVAFDSNSKPLPSIY